MSFQIRKAKRQKLIASIGFIGPSGSGKTLGSLLVAYGMMKAKYPEAKDDEIWEKIALIDTEHERSLVYEGMTHQGVKIGEFLFINFDKPYTVERLDQAVKVAKEAGAEIIITDSTTHFWEADGGLLELQQNYGGRFQDWIKTNKHYQEFIKIVTGERYGVHMFSTVRAKQKHEVASTDTGKLEVKKLGLQPVQRDSLEYEYQVVFNVNMDHIAETSKDNSGIFEGHPQKLNPEVGAKLYSWLEAGEDVKAKEEQERQNILALIRGIIDERKDEAVGIVLQLEQKAKMQADDMPLKMLSRLHQVLVDKLEEIDIKKNMEATDKEMADAKN